MEKTHYKPKRKPKVKESTYGIKIDQADSLLTKLKSVLRKHWLMLIFLIIVYGCYKFCVLVGEEMDKDNSKPTNEIVHPAGSN
jgi:hypothetical protein